jgi:hypothetical protein
MGLAGIGAAIHGAMATDGVAPTAGMAGVAARGALGAGVRGVAAIGMGARMTAIGMALGGLGMATEILGLVLGVLGTPKACLPAAVKLARHQDCENRNQRDFLKVL